MQSTKKSLGGQVPVFPLLANQEQLLKTPWSSASFSGMVRHSPYLSDTRQQSNKHSEKHCPETWIHTGTWYRPFEGAVTHRTWSIPIDSASSFVESFHPACTTRNPFLTKNHRLPYSFYEKLKSKGISNRNKGRNSIIINCYNINVSVHPSTIQADDDFVSVLLLPFPWTSVSVQSTDIKIALRSPGNIKHTPCHSMKS